MFVSFFVFLCLLVRFRLRHDIDMMQLLATDKVTISANDLYWRNAFQLSGAPSFKGLRRANPQSSPLGIYNGALICMIMNINELI